MPTFSEPTWGTPTVGDTLTSTYDWHQITPLEMQGVIVRLVQEHFSNADNIVKTQLKTYLWNDNKTQTKILIDTGADIDLDVADGVTASIHIVRDDVKLSSAGILRKVVVTIDGDTYPDGNYVRLGEGKYIIMCASTNPVLADYLGEEVLMRMMRFSPLITREFRLFDIDVVGFGKVTVKEKSQPKIYYAPVVLQWSKMYSWSLDDEEIY